MTIMRKKKINANRVEVGVTATRTKEEMIS
jgi:hypothetical protein